MISIRFNMPKGDYCTFVWHNVCKTAQKKQHAQAKGSAAGRGFSGIFAALVGIEDKWDMRSSGAERLYCPEW